MPGRRTLPATSTTTVLPLADTGEADGDTIGPVGSTGAGEPATAPAVSTDDPVCVGAPLAGWLG